MIDQRVKTILPGRTIHRTRRQVLRDSGLAGGALATGFATSSGPWFVRGASAQDKTKIKVWFPYPLIPEQGEQVQTYAQLINDFNAQSTTTEAEVFTTNWSPEKLVTAVAGGDPPDIFYMD